MSESTRQRISFLCESERIIPHKTSPVKCLSFVRVGCIIGWRGIGTMPILDGHTLDLISHSRAQTAVSGRGWAAMLHGRRPGLLEGGLGTARPAVQGSGGAWAVGRADSPAIVTSLPDSPSQNLERRDGGPGEPGRGRPLLYHVDSHRLQTAWRRRARFGWRTIS